MNAVGFARPRAMNFSLVVGPPRFLCGERVKYRFEFRRYKLPFRRPVRTAHGGWSEREGILLKLTREGLPAGVKFDDEGRPVVGYGEAAPVRGFSTETVDECEEGCLALGAWIEPAAIGTLPTRLASVHRALDAAFSEIGSRGPADTLPPHIGVAALLPAGKAALTEIMARLESGFRVFKWKVGVGEIANELGLLDDLCATLPTGARLRLDANGAWDRRRAERWLERCAERPIEFVEQPCFSAASEGTTAQRRAEDVLMGLANDYPTPVALDESLVGNGDIERWTATGWPGVFVVKPSLIGELTGALTLLEKAKADVVFSSALETAIGARSALRTAFAWREPKKDDTRRALGFGVWPLFADPRFDGPAAAPFIRKEDLETLDAEQLWTALN